MLSKSQISFVKSLHYKKFRKEHRLFIVEGIKSVSEYMHSKYLIKELFFTEDANLKLANLSQILKVNQITYQDLTRISTLSTPQNVLALVQLPEDKDIESINFANTFTLALDGIQDPGNLGTIIRVADWFGMKQIICSEDSVEAFNPKVVQSSMGSLSRINIHYLNLSKTFKIAKIPIYAAMLKGTSINKTEFKNEGIILLGNEGKGISAELLKQVDHHVTIPGFGEAESLNVAISASLFCYEIKRNYLK
ncbi:MAG: RNA methyltransferase [Flavobacterium sp.]|nr:RNA methyltransferase [Pedobacter sp.]